jgi:hypothetical protein
MPEQHAHPGPAPGLDLDAVEQRRLRARHPYAGRELAAFLAEDAPALIQAVRELRTILAPLLAHPDEGDIVQSGSCRFCRAWPHAPDCPVLDRARVVGEQEEQG